MSETNQPLPDSEQQVIRGCIAKDRASQAKLYQRYAPKMLGVCLRYADSHEEAEEILHEGFLRVYKYIGNFTGKGSLEGWIRKIMVKVPYFSKDLTLQALVIRNAAITISSNGITDSLRFDSSFSKLYCQYDYYYKGRIPVQLNKAYNLTVVNGSDTYTASANTNLSKTTIDSVSYTPTFNDLYGQHESVIVYFRGQSSEVNYYRYEMVRYVDTSTMPAGPEVHASTCLDRTRKDSTLVYELGRSIYSDVGQPSQQIKIVIEPAYTHVLGTRGTIFVQTID